MCKVISTNGARQSERGRHDIRSSRPANASEVAPHGRASAGGGVAALVSILSTKNGGYNNAAFRFNSPQPIASVRLGGAIGWGK